MSRISFLIIFMLIKLEADSFSELKDSCMKENYDSCFTLGAKYIYAFATKKDIERGLEYINEACKHDVGKACSILGSLYMSDHDGVKFNQDLAIAYSFRGCELENGLGCSNLAAMAYHSSNIKGAIRYYKLGCNYKNDIACKAYQELIDSGLVK